MILITKRRLFRIFLITGGVLLLILGLLHQLNFSLSEEQISERFSEVGIPYTIQKTDGVEWLESGNLDGPLLLFIHGSPGSMDDFLAFHCDPDLDQRFHMISFNRPGYGGASKGIPTPSLTKQAKAAGSLIPEDKTGILIGHSMGAPIAVRLAMASPQQVKKLILLSAALDPDLEEVKRYQRVADNPLISWMLPDVLNVCNRELMPLESELRQMNPLWKSLQVPVIAIHGTKDLLVPVENMNYLQQNLPTEQVDVRLIKDANHFIPWTHFNDVKTALSD